MAPSSRSSTYADEIADRMRDVCAGLSFTEVARRTETNRETARRYLAHGRPSAEFMARLCESFGISGTWILTGRGPRFDPSHQSGTLRPRERTRTPSNARSSRAGRAVSAP